MNIKKAQSNSGSVEAYASSCACVCNCNVSCSCPNEPYMPQYGVFTADNNNRRATNNTGSTNKPSAS